MSWKSIEMQVALPRTQEAGKHQEQMSKQNQRFQESLAQSQLKQQLLERKRVNEFEQIKQTKIKDEEPKSSSDQQDEEREETNAEDETVEHPFLGKKIDLSR